MEWKNENENKQKEQTDAVMDETVYISDEFTRSDLFNIMFVYCNLEILTANSILF